MTLANILFDPHTGIIEYASSSGLPNLLIRKNNGELVRLKSNGGYIGTNDMFTYRENALPNIRYQLERGDTVILRSDGILDAKDVSGRELGEYVGKL